jgi:hypothetical protein
MTFSSLPRNDDFVMAPDIGVTIQLDPAPPQPGPDEFYRLRSIKRPRRTKAEITKRPRSPRS